LTVSAASASNFEPSGILGPTITATRSTTNFSTSGSRQGGAWAGLPVGLIRTAIAELDYSENG
jgi:hypothetical protein